MNSRRLTYHPPPESPPPESLPPESRPPRWRPPRWRPPRSRPRRSRPRKSRPRKSRRLRPPRSCARWLRRPHQHRPRPRQRRPRQRRPPPAEPAPAAARTTSEAPAPAPVLPASPDTPPRAEPAPLFMSAPVMSAPVMPAPRLRLRHRSRLRPRHRSRLRPRPGHGYARATGHGCTGGSQVRRSRAGAAAAVCRAGPQRPWQSRRGELAATGEGGPRRPGTGQAGPGEAGSRPRQAAAVRSAPHCRARLHQGRRTDPHRPDDRPCPGCGARGRCRGARLESWRHLAGRPACAGRLGAVAAGWPGDRPCRPAAAREPGST